MPPAAVRVAQACLVARIAIVLGVLLTVGVTAPPTTLVLPGGVRVALPDGSTWTELALWVLAASVFETAMVLSLGRLSNGSRRVILLVEALVIAVSGLYAAAGIKVALAPLVGAIGGVVLLRLDRVRHTFERAEAERRIERQDIAAVLYQGYAFPEPTALKEVQRVGYRVGADRGAAAPTAAPGSSRE